MSIERQEIEKLATLSRIAINESTIAEVSQRLGSVLDPVSYTHLTLPTICSV